MIFEWTVMVDKVIPRMLINFLLRTKSIHCVTHFGE